MSIDCIKINKFGDYVNLDREEHLTVNAPQPFFAKDGSIALLRQKPLVRNLVLQGGGAKGICYPIFIETLNEGIPFIKSLRDVAGSSAGSIVSFLLASGLSPIDIGTLLDQSNILDEIRGITDGEMHLGKGLFSASNLIRTLRQQSMNSILAFWEANKSDPKLNAKLDELAANPDNVTYINEFKQRIANRFIKGVTFKDLEILHFLEPEKFKKLHLTGYNKKTNATEYFNSENTPDMYCHEAVRISIAIPVIIKPFIHKGEPMSDGGQRDNTPIGIFMDRPDFDPNETFVMVFDRGGKSEKILHAPPIPLEFPIGSKLRLLTVKIIKIVIFVIKIIQSIFRPREKTLENYKSELVKKCKKNSGDCNDSTINGPRPSLHGMLVLGRQLLLDRQIEQAKIHKMGPHVFCVPTKGIGTLSFAARKDTIANAKRIAKLKADEYAKIHQNSGAYQTYVSQEEAIKSLQQNEIDAILNMEINPMWPHNERHFYESVQKQFQERCV